MKPKNIILLLVITGLIAVLFYSMEGSDDDEAYIKEIQKERREKDHFMRTAKESPIADKQNFAGLKYFEPDIRYRIVADLIPVTERKAVVLATNDGKEERYLEYAYAEFTFDGIKNRLLILEIMDMGPYRGKLFLAFGDDTGAGETYGAGRYLDIMKVPGSSTITLDFNKAYNPYCAYNETFSCPLPPEENLLKIAMKAGEKNFH